MYTHIYLYMYIYIKAYTYKTRTHTYIYSYTYLHMYICILFSVEEVNNVVVKLKKKKASGLDNIAHMQRKLFTPILFLRIAFVNCLI